MTPRPLGTEPPFHVSIIIPCYNKVEYTQRCLDALFQNTPRSLRYEVVLVDNASTDGTKDLLARLDGDVQVISNPSNVGFARACNQGARAARSDRLLFLNNDTVPLPGWLEPLLETLGSDGCIGVVGSKLLYPDGNVQHAGMVLAEYKRDDLLFFDHVYRFSPPDAPWVNRQRDLQAVTGACFLIRRETFESVGGFDEAYRNGCEDVDLSLKVRNQGYRVVYCPSSVLYHHECTSEGRHLHEADNLRLLSERWSHRIASDQCRIFIEDGRMGSEYGILATQLQDVQVALHQKEALAHQKNVQLREAQSQLHEKARQIQEIRAETDQEIALLKTTIAGMERSPFWRLRMRLLALRRPLNFMGK